MIWQRVLCITETAISLINLVKYISLVLQFLRFLLNLNLCGFFLFQKSKVILRVNIQKTYNRSTKAISIVITLLT